MEEKYKKKIEEIISIVERKLENMGHTSERAKAKYLGINNSSFRRWKKNPEIIPGKILLAFQEIGGKNDQFSEN